MTALERKQQRFERFRDWLLQWCRMFNDIEHVDYDPERKKFYYGNNSYMDLGELLRQNSGLKSSPCMIYDTDIHLTRTENKDVYLKQHYFYICVLTDEQIEGDAITQAKDRCEWIALKLIAWFRDCKLVNPQMRGYQIGNVDSTTPFLNGWEAVAMRVEEPLGVPCVDEHDYDFDR